MEYAVSALILAWVLSWFGFDDIFVKGMHELFKVNITTNGYYLIFFLLGLLSWIITWVVTKGRMN